jgi:hypothetical protein
MDRFRSGGIYPGGPSLLTRSYSWTINKRNDFSRGGLVMKAIKAILSILAGLFLYDCLPLIWAVVFHTPLPFLTFKNELFHSYDYEPFFMIGYTVAVVAFMFIPWLFFRKEATAVKVTISVMGGVFLFLCLPAIWPALFHQSWSLLPFMNEMLRSRAYPGFFIIGGTVAALVDGIVPWFGKK